MKLNHKVGSGVVLALFSLGVASEAAHAAPLGPVARELRALDHEAKFNLRVLPGLIAGQQSRIEAQAPNSRDAGRVEFVSGALVIASVTIPFLPVAGFAAIGQVGNIAVAGSVATITGLQMSAVFSAFSCSHAFQAFTQAQRDLDQLSAKYEERSARGLRASLINGITLGHSDANSVGGLVELARIQKDLFSTELGVYGL